MASLLKAQSKNASKIDANKKKEKRRREETEEDALMEDTTTVEMAATHEEPPKKRRNKQRVLMLCSRGVTHRMRHLMMDLESLLPHVKKGEHPKGRDVFHLNSHLRLKARFEKQPWVITGASGSTQLQQCVVFRGAAA
jgi:hypothetical protein